MAQIHKDDPINFSITMASDAYERQRWMHTNRWLAAKRESQQEQRDAGPVGYIPVVGGGQCRPDWPRPKPLDFDQVCRTAIRWCIVGIVIGLATWKLAEILLVILK